MPWSAVSLLLCLPVLLVEGVRQSSNDMPIEQPSMDDVPQVKDNHSELTAAADSLIPQDWQPGKIKVWGSHKKEDRLVPGLVFDSGSHVMKIKETTDAEWANEYDWVLESAEGPIPVAKTRGKWNSVWFGHGTVHVYNPSGQNVFDIRSDKNRWNPFSKRWSFRILPPGGKESDDAWYTINKARWGTGPAWRRDEWKIFRGLEKNDDLVYYGVGSLARYSVSFYPAKAAYASGAEPVARISQEFNAGKITGSIPLFRRLVNWLPDKYGIEIKGGEDTALLLAVCTVIDMVNDRKL